MILYHQCCKHVWSSFCSLSGYHGHCLPPEGHAVRPRLCSNPAHEDRLLFRRGESWGDKERQGKAVIESTLYCEVSAYCCSCLVLMNGQFVPSVRHTDRLEHTTASEWVGHLAWRGGGGFGNVLGSTWGNTFQYVAGQFSHCEVLYSTGRLSKAKCNFELPDQSAFFF